VPKGEAQPRPSDPRKNPGCGVESKGWESLKAEGSGQWKEKQKKKNSDKFRGGGKGGLGGPSLPNEPEVKKRGRA